MLQTENLPAPPHPLLTLGFLPSVPEEIVQSLANDLSRETALAQLGQLKRPLLLLGGTACERVAAAVAREPEVAYLVVATRDADSSHLLGDLRLADEIIYWPAELSQFVDKGSAALRRKLRSSRQQVEPFVDDTGITFRGVRVELSRLEQNLVLRLWRSYGRTVTRDELAVAFGPLFGAEVGKALDAHVYRLRKKLARTPGLRIETVRQRGFRLTIND